jgi:hypothetical protein
MGRRRSGTYQPRTADLDGEAGIADDLSFSPDGRLLAISYSEGKTILWDH